MLQNFHRKIELKDKLICCKKLWNTGIVFHRPHFFMNFSISLKGTISSSSSSSFASKSAYLLITFSRTFGRSSILDNVEQHLWWFNQEDEGCCWYLGLEAKDGAKSTAHRTAPQQRTPGPECQLAEVENSRDDIVWYWKGIWTTLLIPLDRVHLTEKLG